MGAVQVDDGPDGQELQGEAGVRPGPVRLRHARRPNGSQVEAVPARQDDSARPKRVQVRVRCHLFDRLVRFGPGFGRLSMQSIRLYLARQEPNVSADEVRKLLGVSGPAHKAIILLGLKYG